jgi:hypothetical protein
MALSLVHDYPELDVHKELRVTGIEPNLAVLELLARALYLALLPPSPSLYLIYVQKCKTKNGDPCHI